MINWEAFFASSKLLFDFYVIFLMFAGVFMGIVIGAIPGLTGGIGIAIMLPFTYTMGPLYSLVLLLSIYTGGLWGGAITAILFNAPGSPASAATALDGYPMTLKGQAGRALGLSVAASTIGGILGVITLVVFMNPLGKVVIGLGSSEMCMIALFAFTVIASLKGNSLARTLFATAFGISIGTVGMTDAGYVRGTYGNVYLMDGFPLIPTLIGFFAISEFIILLEREFITNVKFPQTSVKDIFNGVRAVFTYPILLLRSSIIGVIIGAIPAAGSTVANIVSYNEAKRWSNTPEKYGTGIDEGVIAGEAANNASEGGALLTMLLLGIPGGASTAMLLGALLIQGWVPGPRLIIDHKEIIYAALIAEFIEEFILLGLGIIFATVVAKIINFPIKILIPCLAIFTVIGALSLRGLVFDASLIILFGVLGYFFKKLDYPVIAVVLGFLLGPILDAELIRTFQRFGDISPFYTRPVSLMFLILSVLGLVVPYLFQLRKNRSH